MHVDDEDRLRVQRFAQIARLCADEGIAPHMVPTATLAVIGMQLEDSLFELKVARNVLHMQLKSIAASLAQIAGSTETPL